MSPKSLPTQKGRCSSDKIRDSCFTQVQTVLDLSFFYFMTGSSGYSVQLPFTVDVWDLAVL
jgi:hypothetical protein